MCMINALNDDMPREMLLDCLTLYINKDGGYAHGLHIDNYNTNTSVYQIYEAFRPEQDDCMPWLRMQTKLLGPKIIVCLGRIAAQKLIREDFRITKEHGQWSEKGGIWFMATYHPSALLRDIGKRPEAFRDLKILQAKVKEVCEHQERYEFE